MCGSRLLVAKDGTWYLPGERAGAACLPACRPGGGQGRAGGRVGREVCAGAQHGRPARPMASKEATGTWPVEGACTTFPGFLARVSAACRPAPSCSHLLPICRLTDIWCGAPGGLHHATLCMHSTCHGRQSTYPASCLAPSRSAPRTRGELAHF